MYFGINIWSYCLKLKSHATLHSVVIGIIVNSADGKIPGLETAGTLIASFMSSFLFLPLFYVFSYHFPVQ